MSASFSNMHIFKSSMGEADSLVVPDSITGTFSDSWYSIYPTDEASPDSFQRMRRFAKSCNYLCVVFTCFDEDIWQLSLYNNGKEAAKISSMGECSHARRFAELLFPSDISRNTLKVILSCNNMEQQIDMLEEYLGVALWVILDKEEPFFIPRVARGKTRLEEFQAQINKLKNRPNQCTLIQLNYYEWPKTARMMLYRSLARPDALVLDNEDVLRISGWSQTESCYIERVSKDGDPLWRFAGKAGGNAPLHYSFSGSMADRTSEIPLYSNQYNPYKSHLWIISLADGKLTKEREFEDVLINSVFYLDESQVMLIAVYKYEESGCKNYLIEISLDMQEQRWDVLPYLTVPNARFHHSGNHIVYEADGRKGYVVYNLSERSGTVIDFEISDFDIDLLDVEGNLVGLQSHNKCVVLNQSGLVISQHKLKGTIRHMWNEDNNTYVMQMTNCGPYEFIKPVAIENDVVYRLARNSAVDKVD